MIKNVLTGIVLLCLVQATIAQVPFNRCGAMEADLRLRMEDPNYSQNREQIEQFTQQWVASHPEGVRIAVTIPVVFHVVYNTSGDNLSDAQIQTQLDVLNEDFRRLNADASQTRFSSVAADCEISFCMAARDPSGNATNGIIHKSTSTTSFSTNDNVKKSANGGDDAWDRNSYLNIWVCDLSSGLLGYAQFPGGAASTDGVVLDYAYTGRNGTANAPYDLGRSGTHEVGHWLNLYHIWGDDGTSCNGSDNVSDTPNQADENYGCPYPTVKSSCSNPSPGDMYENYMDYTDDACMNTFTAGQKSRMQALFGSGGSRISLLSSLGCTPPSGGTCNVPSGLGSSSITTTSATVSWSTATGALSYNIQYKPTSGSTWTTTTSSSTSKSLTGLTSNTQYDFKVQSSCSGGTTSNYSSVSNFTTLSAGGCTDILEPNNTKNSAAAISTGTSYNALIATSTDVDWYSFSNSSSQKHIKVTVTSVPDDYDVKLYGTTGTSVGASENSGTTDETIKYNNGSVGTYKVKVYGWSGAFHASDCYILTVSLSSTTWRESGIEEPGTNKSEITLFPNPAQSTISVKFNSTSGTDVKFNVYSMMGQLMYSEQQTPVDGGNSLNVNLSSFNNGVYILEMINGDIVVREKFEVMK